MKKNLFRSLIVMLVLCCTLYIGCDKNTDDQALKAADEKILAGTDATLYGSEAACGKSTGPKISGLGPVETKSVVIQSNIIRNTDFVSGGAGGMRDVGNGTITLPGSFSNSSVSKAYLYWHGVTNATTNVGDNIKVNGKSVEGTNIGVSSSNCWPFANSQAYRADVTSLVKSTIGDTYDLSDFGEMNPNGASFIVFYQDGNEGNNRDVVIFDGNDSNISFAGIPGNPNAPADPQGWDVLLSGIQYESGQANIQLHVGDGQTFQDDALEVNSEEIAPSGEVFQGTTVPGGNLWDIRSFNVTSFLDPGENTLNLTTGLNSDCLSLIAALIDLPAGSAPQASVDFKPQTCPNLFDCSDKGKVSVALVGTTDFDVNEVDKKSIKLNGISPLSVSVKDVSTPYKGKLEDCNSCTKAGPDGKNDLELVFDIQAIAATLGKTTNKQCIKITVEGKLLPESGSAFFSGQDYILIK